MYKNKVSTSIIIIPCEEIEFGGVVGAMLAARDPVKAIMDDLGTPEDIIIIQNHHQDKAQEKISCHRSRCRFLYTLSTTSYENIKSWDIGIQKRWYDVRRVSLTPV